MRFTSRPALLCKVPAEEAKAKAAKTGTIHQSQSTHMSQDLPSCRRLFASCFARRFLRVSSFLVCRCCCCCFCSSVGSLSCFLVCSRTTYRYGDGRTGDCHQFGVFPSVRPSGRKDLEINGGALVCASVPFGFKVT